MVQQKQNRKTYLVGGAVRDSILGLEVEERDWVVVGSTPATLLDEGYVQVGKDFPVFLHPRSKEEYALARTERKVKAGHKGFDCDASETITLEEDLFRRDLTINAIAEDDEGNLIDPYNGTSDLENHILRHISEAFEEDPLRILRVARFLAKFGHFNFQVAEETKALCKKMVDRGDLEELPAERIYQELDKALSTDQPSLFFEFLHDISAGDYLWPDLTPGDFDRLQKVTTDTNSQRFAVLLSRSSSQSIKAITEKLRTPRSYAELAMLCHDHFNSWISVDKLNAEQKVSFLYRTDAFRKTERFFQFGATCDAIYSLDHVKEPNLGTWRTHFDVTTNITSSSVDACLEGPAIGAAIKKYQIEAVEELSNNNAGK
jgi:tRNA nucleotidyltransferase (CCA-adding enzyme)